MLDHQMICLNGIDTSNKLAMADYSRNREKRLKTQELHKVYENRGKGWLNLNLSSNAESVPKKPSAQVDMFPLKRRLTTSNGYHVPEYIRPIEERISGRFRPKLLTDVSSSYKNDFFVHQPRTFDSKGNLSKVKHRLHERLSHQPRVIDSISSLHYVPKYHTASRIHQREAVYSAVKSHFPVSKPPASSISKKHTEESSDNPESSLDEMQTRKSLLNQKRKYIQGIKTKQPAENSSKKESQTCTGQMKQYLETWKTVLPELFAVLSTSNNSGNPKIDKLLLLQAKLKDCLSHRNPLDGGQPAASVIEQMEEVLFLMDGVQESIENGILRVQKSLAEDEQVRNIFGGP